jgi:hypothetical protein
MAKSSVDTKPLEKASKIFSAETRKRLLAAAGKRMGAAAESVIPDYPEPSVNPLEKFYTRTTAFGKPTKPYQSKFKSDKQAYYVLFVLSKEGKIPYQRTGLLGRSITSAISNLTGESVTVTIGTAVKSAPLVIGDDDQQSHYHKGHWWQLHAVMDENSEMIQAEGAKSLLEGIEQEVDKL